MEMASFTMKADDITERNGRWIDVEPGEGCPECAGELVTERRECLCRDCGLVVTTDWLDYRGPPGYTEAGSPKRRTGAPMSPAKHDFGLSTVIGLGKDAKGNRLDARTRRRLGRLRTHQSRARFDSKGERNLAHGFQEVNRIRSGLDLQPIVRDRACTLYRGAQSENLIVGRSIEAMAAGAVFTACREGSWLRTAKEIGEIAGIPPSTVRNAYRVYRSELGVAVNQWRPHDYLSRFASAISAPAPLRVAAIELVNDAERAGIDIGRHPGGVAAACLYQAGQSVGPMVTQSTLADIADVTPVTIRARVRELQELEV